MKIFYGKRDAMVSECSVPEFYSGEWLVCPGEDDGAWDAEGFSTEDEAREQAEYLADINKCDVVRVGSADEWAKFLASMSGCPDDGAPDDYPIE